eukprot:gnl/MRDRNA2_/MRDRNA2_200769_c0_seq1.p1 gnl/MRDRNA2_/MRDRNA2_200769_c0~~gnl/MRDRNA2_/MRDRNA2_200769_c0_seq1.p1  ORF type:complete len:194 (+),score=17.45 gnl/MRDRNA2_/MRDRNA2_200769_c0_seq1:55-582(+)
MSVPAHNTTAEMLSRRRFGWGMKENSQQALLVQAGAILITPATAVPSIRYFGLKGTLQWSQRLCALNSMINALALDDRMLRLTPLFLSLQHGTAAFNRAVAAESQHCGAGQGEKEAAVRNLDILPGTIMPNIYSEIWARTLNRHPGTVCVLCALLHCINSELTVPLLWPASVHVQ